MSFRLSYEFFPPRTEKGLNSLYRVADKLDEFRPDFFSVTYGAGGSTRDGTKTTVAHLNESGRSAAPHLSMGDDAPDVVNAMLDDYKKSGVNRIVALRGDVPSGLGGRTMRHNAQDLVHLIREHSGDHFHLEVGAYPETHPDADSPAKDLDFFKRKVDAGANSAITQYFYNVHSYLDFVNRAEQAGISIPIYPGIMPINNFEGIVRFSENCGADIPRWLHKHLEAYQDDEDRLRAFGVDMVTQICEDLIKVGVPGIHFYTLNRWGSTQAICSNLNLQNRES